MSRLRGADRAIRHHIIPKDRLLILEDIHRIRESEVTVLEKAAGLLSAMFVLFSKLLIADMEPSFIYPRATVFL